MDSRALEQDDFVEAVARRVVELLAPAMGAPRRELVTAAEIAKRFHVDRSWVYGNASRLGAVRLGSGPKARLRFDADHVAAVLADAPDPFRPEAPASNGRRATRDSVLPPGVEPLRGRKERR